MRRNERKKLRKNLNCVTYMAYVIDLVHEM